MQFAFSTPTPTPTPTVQSHVYTWECDVHFCCHLVRSHANVRMSSLFVSSRLDFISFKPNGRLQMGKRLVLQKCRAEFRKIASSSSSQQKNKISFQLVHLVVGVVLLMSVTVALTPTQSWSLSEENRLFLEAWRTLDRAYVDKTFNGQSWFRYRENALRNEPMNTRQETYTAIRKMVASLNDPFTRFLEPERLKSLRSGTQSSLTGVGLSIGYPTSAEGSKLSTGLAVISAAPGGPASRAGILPGDVILAIDDAETDGMGIYDAANILQVEFFEFWKQRYGSVGEALSGIGISVWFHACLCELDDLEQCHGRSLLVGR